MIDDRFTRIRTFRKTFQRFEKIRNNFWTFWSIEFDDDKRNRWKKKIFTKFSIDVRTNSSKSFQKFILNQQISTKIGITERNVEFRIEEKNDEWSNFSLLFEHFELNGNTLKNLNDEKIWEIFKMEKKRKRRFTSLWCVRRRIEPKTEIVAVRTNLKINDEENVSKLKKKLRLTNLHPRPKLLTPVKLSMKSLDHRGNRLKSAERKNHRRFTKFETFCFYVEKLNDVTTNSRIFVHQRISKIYQKIFSTLKIWSETKRKPKFVDQFERQNRVEPEFNVNRF